jgi:hypothetical protein
VGSNPTPSARRADSGLQSTNAPGSGSSAGFSGFDRPRPPKTAHAYERLSHHDRAICAIQRALPSHAASRPGEGASAQHANPTGRRAPYAVAHRLLAVRVISVTLVLVALGLGSSSESPASEWQERPVVPVLGPRVASHLKVIAGRGQGHGNRPGIVAKIGDSITASPSFMQALACWPPRLGRWGDLRGTLRFFGQTPVPGGTEERECPVSNSYSRLGVAAVRGWRAVDAISPRGSLPECQGLAPVSCELQLLRPAVALIMFGTNDLEDISAARFRLDLAHVVRLVSNAGTIPVVSTIPPRARPPFSQRVARFNAEIARLAKNRGLPLWNYWRQMVGPGVPHQGLGRDGVHPSVRCPPCTAIDFRPKGLRQGYAMRNLGALRVLDRLRRRVPLDGE